MKFPPLPFAPIEWAAIPAVECPGGTGTAVMRTVESGDLRMRLVEYSPDFTADHWCVRGHIALVLEGICVLQIQDGREYTLTPGMSFYIGDDTDPHRVFSEAGCTVFIVD
jgi:quercetin dioxygenase-like cupin family protein